MRIAVDASSVWTNSRGLGKYAEHIIASLIAMGKDEVVALVPYNTDSFNYVSQHVGVQVQGLEIDTWWGTDDFEEYWIQNVIQRYLVNNHVDVFFGPTFDVPLEWNGPSVITVHDRIFELSSKHHPSYDTHNATWARTCAHKATHIIAVSNYVAHDISIHWEIKPKKITTIYSAPTLELIAEDHDTSRQVINDHFNFSGRYILHVGGWHPRKNAYRLLSAFSKLHPHVRKGLSLVILGDTNPYVEAVLDKYSILNKVVLTGYCATELMPYLYRGAEMLVYPSRAEGFGIPPLEAMISEIPVISSNVTSLPEVIQDAGILIDPEDTDQIARYIEVLLTDSVMRDDLIKRGRERVRAFSWSKTANETRALLEYVVKTREG